MNLRYSFLFFFLLFAYIANAQETFISKGKIEFERKINIHKQLQADASGDDAFMSTMVKSLPQYKVNYFDLYFNNNKTIYKPGREAVAGIQKVPEWMEGPANDNTVYSDLDQQMSVSQKAVFEDLFNIQDSIKKVDWKITADTRVIAGFNCRKATTILMDSVFVFAFYTEQVVTPGGPESFSGLPGMILGLAIPRLNATWFATKLELVDVKEETLLQPKKGKKTNMTNLKLQLNSAMKDWGRWKDKYIWQIMI